MHIELKLNHYISIRNLMEDFEPETPEDALTSEETEALDIVKKIIFNIEKRRAHPKARAYAYKKRAVA